MIHSAHGQVALLEQLIDQGGPDPVARFFNQGGWHDRIESRERQLRILWSCYPGLGQQKDVGAVMIRGDGFAVFQCLLVDRIHICLDVNAAHDRPSVLAMAARKRERKTGAALLIVEDRRFRVFRHVFRESLGERRGK
jgi:hypothetical protein